MQEMNSQMNTGIIKRLKQNHDISRKRFKI